MKYVGALLILMMVGLAFSGATSIATTLPKSPTPGEQDVSSYDEFWMILYNESKLVSKLQNANSSNASLVDKVVLNSRKGEENAVKISYDVWSALQQLKKAGVKLYYSARELREIAQNISEHGLPNATVSELKKLGWGDNEINALVEYINKTKGNITGPFNMSSFLENFSLAFVEVGMKYASYETLAFKILGKQNQESTKVALNDFKDATKGYYPNVSAQWANFRIAYLSNQTEGMIEAINNISNILENIFKGALKFVDGGGVVFGNSSSKYYWPDAMKAYNLSRQMYVILKAMKLGNGDKRLGGMLDQMIVEFENSTLVYHKGKPSNPSQGGPTLPCFHNLCPDSEINPTYSSQVIAPGSVSPLLGTYGNIVIDNVKVVVDSVNSKSARYHVVVQYHVLKNSVFNVTLKVKDLRGYDSYKAKVIFPNTTKTWKSREFTVYFNGRSKVTVMGSVEVDYTSVPLSVKTSEPNPQPPINPKPIDPKPINPNPNPILALSSSPTAGSSSPAKPKPKEFSVWVSYSHTIKNPVDPRKVSFVVVPSSEVVNSGNNVSLIMIVMNNNTQPVNGKWTVYVTVPGENGSVRKVPISGNVTVPGSGFKVINVGSFAYAESGNYSYSGTLRFGSSELRNGGMVEVKKGEKKKRAPVVIEKVNVSNEFPLLGNLTLFNVTVKSFNYTGDLPIALYIDGKRAYARNVTLKVGTQHFVLGWFWNETGWHNYEIVLGNGTSKRSGTVYVRRPLETFAVKLEVVPKVLRGGGRVYFLVKVWNFENSNQALLGFVEDGKGAIVKRIKGFAAWVPPNAKNYTLIGGAFSLNVYGIGNHTFKLFLDNSDGKPNREGDEHWSNVTVEVEPTNGTKLEQVSAECSNLYFTWEVIDYHATLTCQAVLYNPTNESLTILNSPTGKPWIATSDSGVSMTPSSFNKHLSKFVTDVSNARISPQGDTVITFKSEISGVPLAVLEYYWGTYYTITIPYDVHLSNGKILSFALKGSGQITQNNYEVAADIGVNVFLFKGIPAELATLKTAIQVGEYTKALSGVRTLITILKEVIGWYKWFH